MEWSKRAGCLGAGHRRFCACSTCPRMRAPMRIAIVSKGTKTCSQDKNTVYRGALRHVRTLAVANTATSFGEDVGARLRASVLIRAKVTHWEAHRVKAKESKESHRHVLVWSSSSALDTNPRHGKHEDSGQKPTAPPPVECRRMPHGALRRRDRRQHCKLRGYGRVTFLQVSRAGACLAR